VMVIRSGNLRERNINASLTAYCGVEMP